MITTYISEILTTASVKTSTPTAYQHILMRYFDAVEPNLDFEQKTNYLWQFGIAEKALLESRKGNYSYAEFYFNQIAIDNTCRNPCNLIALPAIAFFEYTAKEDYVRALDLLRSSINDLLETIREQRHFFLLAAVLEQYLNICRVVYKTDKHNSLKEGGKLISYILSGISECSYADLPNKEILDLLNEKERFNMLTFVTDVLLFKVFELKRMPEIGTELDDVFSRLKRPLLPAQTNKQSSYTHAANFILETFRAPQVSQLDDLYLIFPHLQDLSKPMQFVLLNQVSMLCNLFLPEGNSVTAEIHKYCKETLLLSHLYQEPKEYVRRPTNINISSEGAIAHT